MSESRSARPVTGVSEGKAVVISGPDGTGKSTLVEALVRGPLASFDVMRIHHRPRLLPGRSSVADASRPHAKAPYPGWLGLIKVLYLFADYHLGWLLRVRPHTRRGGWVLIERGWSDLIADPARYRLSNGRTAKALSRFLPAVDRTIVLTAPASTIGQRKGELSADELQRQLTHWRERTKTDGSMLLLDVDRPVNEVVTDVAKALFTSQDANRDWVALPNKASPRWLLPKGPASVTAAGLRVHHPVSGISKTSWRAASIAARLGALGLVPRSSLPAPVGELLGTIALDWTHVALSASRQHQRLTGLLLRGDEAVAIAKIGLDEHSRQALDVEAAALAEAGSLPDPLTTPDRLEHRPGLLVLDYVPWRLRRKPWKLEATVAGALGAWNAKSGRMHGDFAPWNLLRTRHGWALIDWEDSSADYPPMFDVWHYLVQAYTLLGRPRRSELLAGIRGSGWVGESLEAYTHMAGISVSDPHAAFIDYLDASRSRLDLKTTDGRRGLKLREELRAQVGRAGRRVG